MAAPTNVRVEATSISTTDIRWDYSGSNTIAVFRSTDGVSYSEVTSTVLNTRVATGTLLYTDTSLATGTKYWYKLSDDGGSTFSSVVTVITHTCVGPSGDQTSLTLPRFDSDEDITAEQLNDMSQRIEEGIAAADVNDSGCVACVTDGAVVIDCTSGCTDWSVIASTNINSISIDWCDQFDGNIEFVVPPNTTVGICGFPAGFGFSGDECTQAPISGGSTGRTLGVTYYGNGGGGGGQAGSGTQSSPTVNKGRTGGNSYGTGGSGWPGGRSCTCVPRMGGLTIKSCNANNSLNCSSTKSLKLIACGGRQPYTWSRTGSVQLQGGNGQAIGASATGTTITVTPPTNSGSGVAGVAYTKNVAGCIPSLSQVNYVYKEYTCNDVAGSNTLLIASADLVCTGGNITCASIPQCRGTNAEPGNCNCGSGNFPGTTGVVPDTYCTPETNGTVCDKRTAGMISSNCVPCGLSAGATVSVTDAAGVTTTVILKA